MKKIYKTAILALIGHAAVAQSFFVPTTYRGAFEPAPTPMWTDNWTEWDPQNAAYPAPTVTVNTNITLNTTWTASNTYLLQGQIFVKNGATLTIEPGTVIRGDKASTGAGLFICQGSKIIAIGTASQPIVFTSDQAPGSRSIGDWGGLIIMGKASNNQPGGIANIEGLAPGPDTQFGGGSAPEDDDDSGVLKYVRIEWGGYVYAPNKEINGLTFGSVGSSTVVDHVQVSFANDDGFEWFGGTVNAKYLVSFRNLDDDFDTDFGYRGKVQFALSVRDPNLADNPSVSTSEGFESDNDASGSAATPQTAATFSNVTLIGPYRGNIASPIASGYRRGARLRRNTALKIYNSIFMDHPRGIHIDGAATEANAGSGALKFKHNLIAGTSAGKTTEVNVGSTFNIVSFFAANMNDSLTSTSGILTTPYNYTAPDYRPASASPALSNSDFTDASIAPYVLFAPATTSMIYYCQNATASALTATAAPGNTLLWYTSPTGGTGSTTSPVPVTSVDGVTMYYVSQANGSGDESPRSSITVTVYATPATPMISASGPTSFCTGGSVTLTSSASSGNAWSNGSTSNAITVTSTGSFTVTYTDANGCTATSAPMSVNVSSAPLPTVAVSGITTLCMGETVTLTSSAADSYSWSPNGETTQSITVSASGNYAVTTTNANACDGVGTSASTTVTVNPVPTASAGIASTTGYVVTFSNSSTGATSYTWDFGDASNSSATAPTHAYATNGSYTVMLIATNGSCSDTTMLTVNITVGIQEAASLTGVKMYPNPADEIANLELSVKENSEATWMIMDVAGKLIRSESINLTAGTNVISFETAQLEAGMYFVRIVSNRESATFRLVVKR